MGITSASGVMIGWQDDGLIKSAVDGLEFEFAQVDSWTCNDYYNNKVCVDGSVIEEDKSVYLQRWDPLNKMTDAQKAYIDYEV